MTRTRNAVHMPTNFDPMAYEFVDAFDNEEGDPGARIGILEDYEVHGVTVKAYSPVGASKNTLRILLDQSPTSRYGKDRGYQCDHCGAHIRYVCVLLHVPSGDHMAVGETCLDNRVGSMDKASWRVAELRKAAQARKQAEINRIARNDALHNDPALAAFIMGAAMHKGKNGFVDDVASKFRQYGSLSVRQIESGIAAIERDLARDAEEAQRAQEICIPTPEGKVTFEGVVVSRKFHDNEWGGGWKITVKVTEANGIWLVWVSEPAAIETERGDIVKMSATLTRSNKDVAFAFGKRPSKAEIIGHSSNNLDDALAPLDVQ